MEEHKAHKFKYLSNEFGLLLIASMCVFLFILFFQPFPLEMLEYEDRLLYVCGFWIISFILGGSVYILLPFIFPGRLQTDLMGSGALTVLSAIYLATSSTAFSFYIHFVGRSPMTLYIAFKVILVCLLPLVILIILYRYKSMKQAMNLLENQIRYSVAKAGQDEKEGDAILEIHSDNKSDNLKLKYRNIVLIKSADNYFEVFYKDNNLVERKLIRGTLTNIESQLVSREEFLKCHRTSIANLKYIDALVRGDNGYNIKFNCLEETIPVSRTYLSELKNALSPGE